MPHPLALFSGRRLHLKTTKARDGRLPRPSRVLPCPPLCGAGASRTRQEAFAASSRPFLRASAPSENNEGARRTSSPPRAFPCLLPCVGADTCSYPPRVLPCLLPCVGADALPRPSRVLPCPPLCGAGASRTRQEAFAASSRPFLRASAPSENNEGARRTSSPPRAFPCLLPCVGADTCSYPPRVLPCLLPCVGADVFPAHPALCSRPPLHGRTPVNANKKRLRGG